MFRNFTSDDYATMALAYEMAAAILKIDRTQTDHSLGWTIMKLFDQGMRDAKQLALAAVDKEERSRVRTT